MEVIIKYNGDILAVSEELGAQTEILSSDFAIMSIEPGRLDELFHYSEIEYAELAKRLGIVDNPGLDSSCITPIQRDPTYGLTGQGVIVAILDSGIDYTHPDFRNEDGTSRIIFIWDQNIAGNPPKGFNIGSEYDQSQINAALEAIDQGEPGDLVPHVDSNGHGTAVAGIAAGNGRGNERYLGAAPEASIIAVKLASNQSKFFTRTTDLMRAIKYVTDKAKQMKMPLCINISFGTNEGSHMGMNLFEQYIDEASTMWTSAVIIASGNEGYAKHHYRNRISTNEEDTVEFTVGPGITSLTVVLWKYFVDTLDFEIISPEGISSGRVIGNGAEELFVLGNVRVTCLIGQPTPYMEDQGVYFEFDGINDRAIPASLWKIRVFGRDVVIGVYDMWLPITEIVGLETAFLRPSVETTLTLPGSAERAITVSAYNPVDGSFAEFSGRGTTRNDLHVKPDIAAPGVNITSAKAGGGYSSFTGTSFAAPFVTGGSALLMQWGIVLKNDVYLYGQRLKAYLKSGATRSLYTDYPDISWGFGRLCIKSSLDSLIRHGYLKGGVNNTPLLSERFIPLVDHSSRIDDNETAIQTFSTATPPLEEENIPINDQEEVVLNPVIDPRYGDLVIFYNPDIIDRLEELPDVTVSGVVASKYAIVHLPWERRYEYADTVFKDILWELPVVCGLLDRVSMEVSGITAVQNQPFLNLNGQGVLIGIIDTGIDYTMDIFKFEDDTSKVAYLWDQSISGTTPKEFAYGAEFDHETLNRAINSENPYDIVPSRDDVGHGTFLASLAGGREDDKGNKGAAPDAEFIVVKLKDAKEIFLKEEIIHEGADAYESSDVMTAIEYIYLKSIELGKPVAICLGIGSNNGAHDGLSFFERYISEMTVLNKMAIISAVGNEGNLSHHVYGKLIQNGNPYVIEMRVGQNETGFILNLWSYSPDRISISITSPVGSVVQRIQYGAERFQRSNFILEKTQIEIRYTFPSSRNGDQLVYIRFIDPTPGLWEISVYGDLILDGRFNAWLPIAPFVDADTAFLSPSAGNTATIPATSNGIISVGAYSATERSIYISSSRGPSTSGLQCPDLCAPGVNTGGYFPKNEEGIMSGTSVAAAITTGAAALVLQWAVINKNDPVVNTLKMRSYLIQGCTQRDGIMYPDDLWGYGELNLIQSFERIKGRG